MNEQEMNVAIAEACGWSVKTITRGAQVGFALFDPFGKQRGGMWGDVSAAWRQKIWGNPKIPNYIRDLNAMHEAEQCFTNLQACEYSEYLEDVCGTDGWEIIPPSERLLIVSATALQRAEAFLMTLGKFTPTPKEHE